MRKIDPIITRLQVHIGGKTRKEAMKKIGIPENTLKTWVSRDNIPEKRLAEFAEREGLNLDWLINGTGEKFKAQRGEASMVKDNG